MASSGPNSPGTLASTSTDAPGSAAWTTPSNAATSNNTRTSIYLGSTGTQLSHFLKATGFGFSIPSGATIDGVLVEVERSDGTFGGGATSKDHTVKLYKGGTIQGTNKADTSTAWPSADTIASYGGAADLWGSAWTDTDINDSGFGVGVAITQNVPSKGPSTNAQVDHIRITVYYTASGGGPTSASALLLAGD